MRKSFILERNEKKCPLVWNVNAINTANNTLNLSNIIKELKRDNPNVKKCRNINTKHSGCNYKKSATPRNTSDLPKYRPQKVLDGSGISTHELGHFMNDVKIFSGWRRAQSRSKSKSNERSHSWKRDSSITLQTTKASMKSNIAEKAEEQRNARQSVKKCKPIPSKKSPLTRFINVVYLSNHQRRKKNVRRMRIFLLNRNA